MWTKKRKENKNSKHSGICSNYGFKRTISILLVLCLVASQVYALPNKAGMFQRMEQTLQKSSQENSMTKLETTNGELVLTPEQQEKISKKLNELSTESTNIEFLADDSTDLLVILERATDMAFAQNDELVAQNAEKDKIIAKQEGQIAELKKPKIGKLIELSGTYNTEIGWGAEAAIGLEFGNVITKVGAEASVADLINPVKLKDLDTYKFKATVGLRF